MDNLLILAGSSLPLPEDDDPDIALLNYEASTEYDGMELVNAIDTEEFKSIYILTINKLKQTSIMDQRRLCLGILAKVKKVYDFEFLPHPALDNQIQMNDVYDLLKFLNYDYTSFFGDVWRYLNADLRKINLESFCNINADKIINEIEEQLKSRDMSEMVSLFLRTYNKEDLIKWFIRSTEKQKMLILLRSLEEN